VFCLESTAVYLPCGVLQHQDALLGDCFRVSARCISGSPSMTPLGHKQSLYSHCLFVLMCDLVNDLLIFLMNKMFAFRRMV